MQLGFAADYTCRPANPQRELSLPRPRVPTEFTLRKSIGGRSSSVLSFGHSFDAEAEVIMSAARESAHFTQQAERTNVGPHTLEQLDADLRNLIRAYPGRPVFPTFLELVDLRNRAFDLLEGQQYPAQSRDLYLIAGVTCGVMSNASFDLGHMDAAATQARTAYLCAELAGSDWLRTWVRGMQSLIAYWGDHFEEAVSLASSIRESVSGQGSAAVRLASIEARAHARMGNAEGVETALAAATNARETADHPDEYGGMMDFPLEKQLFYDSTCQVWLGGQPRLHRAVREASRAVSMFEQAPPGQRRIGEMCLARLDLAAARLGSGELDGTVEQVRAVFSDAANRRTDSVKRRLQQVRIQLEAPRVRTSPLAAVLRDEIIEFCAPPSPALPEGHTP
ncbi:XRE family transcriptional regulator [Nocardiopsis sp. CC223A]|uniref:XRE family transcriptional regulator n=1 Tax=Nocardiopsis sp. CC223A TaxID=3044051 RepID=UPI00278C0705|nr:XRE family transcriptional regulator [Nocardiopsis sp. CC223A]